VTCSVAAPASIVPAERPPLAWGPLAAVVVAEVALLVAFAGRYGYSRDELYFLRSGHEAALGYLDNPPLTPLVAAAMDTLASGSPAAVRIPSALAAGLVVLLTGLMARKFGGERTAQLARGRGVDRGQQLPARGRAHPDDLDTG
jgi:hypothetical protein